MREIGVAGDTLVESDEAFTVTLSNPGAGTVLGAASAAIMKKHILIYGVCGGLLILLLKLIEYRFLVVERSLEIYGGLVALLFAAVGIWLGLKFTKTKETVIVKEVPR